MSCFWCASRGGRIELNSLWCLHALRPLELLSQLGTWIVSPALGTSPETFEDHDHCLYWTQTLVLRREHCDFGFGLCLVGWPFVAYGFRFTKIVASSHFLFSFPEGCWIFAGRDRIPRPHLLVLRRIILIQFIPTWSSFPVRGVLRTGAASVESSLLLVLVSPEAFQPCSYWNLWETWRSLWRRVCFEFFFVSFGRAKDFLYFCAKMQLSQIHSVDYFIHLNGAKTCNCS